MSSLNRLVPFVALNDRKSESPAIWKRPLLEFCTLTGADDSTDQMDLFRLSTEYPFVEWGVLFHDLRQGNGRYPSFAWIKDLCLQMRRYQGARFALHVCGHRAVLDYLNGIGEVSLLSPHFPRIQLNLNASSVDVKLLADTIQRHPEKIHITQHNDVNRHLWHELRELDNHAVLFDESGGRGFSPSNWSTPLPAKRCGYAGGLGPDNLERELPRIVHAASPWPFWIDMEGKLRDNLDHFDVSVARRCLAMCSESARQGP
jgi:hypothetical protein